MATFAALITAAITKVAQTNPALDREDGPSADEARIAFTEALLIELGLAPTPVAAHAPVSEAPGTPTKARTEEAPAAPKKPKTSVRAIRDKVMREHAAKVAAETAAAPSETDSDVEALTVAVAELSIAAPAAEEPKAKKPKAPKKVKEPEAPVSNAGAGAEPEPAKEKKKPGPKPKAVKAEGPVNLDKLNPTQKKYIKKIAEELKVEPKEKEFLAWWKAQEEASRAVLTPLMAGRASLVLGPSGTGKSTLINLLAPDARAQVG